MRRFSIAASPAKRGVTGMGESHAHDLMALSKHPREQMSDYGGRQPLYQPATRKRVLDAILVEGLFGPDGHEQVRVSPDPERPANLFVAESFPADVPIVASFPAYAQRADPDREGDETAIPHATGPPLDADESRPRHQIEQRVGPLMPSEDVVGASGHERATRKDPASGRPFRVHGAPGDSRQHPAEHHTVHR
jgi:hypothetical protein